MRRFLITSPKFTGLAEAWYNDAGTLCKVDLTQAEMDEQITIHFIQSISTTIANIGRKFSKETAIVETDYEISFEQFWKDYPLHRNRYKVEKVWNSISKANQVKAFHSLSSYKKYLSRQQWQSAMIGDRYLRDREFETEWNKI